MSYYSVKFNLNKEGGEIQKYREGKTFIQSFVAVGIDIAGRNKTIKEAVTLRIYKKGKFTYACIWVDSLFNICGGASVADHGGGCDNNIAYATNKAIKAANIELLHGAEVRTNDDIRDALVGIAQAAGFQNVFIVDAHK